MLNKNYVGREKPAAIGEGEGSGEEVEVLARISLGGPMTPWSILSKWGPLEVIKTRVSMQRLFLPLLRGL